MSTSNTAGPMYNTENTVGFSGAKQANLQLLAGDQRGFATAQSGAQTIASGYGTLISVIGLTSLLSGAGPAPTSQSGCIINVYDGVSGLILNPQSGASNYAANTAGILYQFNYGGASGILATGTGLPLAPPDVTQINAVFRSGLIACISGGVVGTVGISLIYSRGV